MKKTNKPTFSEFINKRYGITMTDFDKLNEYLKKACEIDYKNRYGTIKWF